MGGIPEHSLPHPAHTPPCTVGHDSHHSADVASSSSAWNPQCPTTTPTGTRSPLSAVPGYLPHAPLQLLWGAPGLDCPAFCKAWLPFPAGSSLEFPLPISSPRILEISEKHLKKQSHGDKWVSKKGGAVTLLLHPYPGQGLLTTTEIKLKP